MPTFSPPTALDLPSVNPYEPQDPLASRLWRHFGVRGPRGRSLLKNDDGTYTLVDTPTSDECDAAKEEKWPDGGVRPVFYLGGHRYEVTAAEAADLTAAGYGGFLS